MLITSPRPLQHILMILLWFWVMRFINYCSVTIALFILAVLRRWQYWDYIASIIGWLRNLEQLVEWELAQEIEVLGENQPKCHFFFITNRTWTDVRSSPGRRSGKSTVNGLNYGTARYNRVLSKSFRPQGIARVGDVRNTKFWSETPRGRDHLEDPGFDGMIILKVIL
jgi:hypothetical protein